MSPATLTPKLIAWRFAVSFLEYPQVAGLAFCLMFGFKYFVVWVYFGQKRCFWAFFGVSICYSLIVMLIKSYVILLGSMKQKISVTVDKDTLLDLESLIASGIFRNRSHAFEYALRLLREIKR